MAATMKNSTVAQKVSRWVVRKENSKAASKVVLKARCWADNWDSCLAVPKARSRAARMVALMVCNWADCWDSH